MDTMSRKIGKKFKQVLINNNISQEKAAMMLGVDERTIRRWVKDGIDRLSTLEKIGEKLSIDVISTFFE